MTKETQILLSEKHLYVSYGMLTGLAGLILLLAITIVRVNSVPELIREMKELQIEQASFRSEIQTRVSTIEKDINYIETQYQITFPR